MVISGLRKIKRKNPIKNIVLTVPPKLSGGIFIFGRIGCLDEDTKITVPCENGALSFTIKDLPKNFNVSSFNFETNKKEICDAEKVFTGEKECYEVILEDGSKILATGEHKFFTSEGLEIETRSIERGDDLYHNNDKRGMRIKTNIEKRIISEKKSGISRPDMMGDNNVSKRPEIREKLSKKLSGKGNGMYGKKHNNHTKNIISKKVSGRNNGMKKPGIKEKHRNIMNSQKVKNKIRDRMRGYNNPLYTDGKTVGEKNNRKKYLRIAKANKEWVCEICRKNKTNNNFDLIVHHVDGNNHNNKLNNLKILCQSCHAKLHHSLNKK